MFINCHIEYIKSGQTTYSEDLANDLDIELETEFRRCSIKVDSIVCIYEASEDDVPQTYIIVQSGEEYCIQESYDEIMAMIKHEKNEAIHDHNKGIRPF
jgi:uncharacterized protein YlzI (FlbEa/FlbD family)